jgi:hypothetical protein
LPVWTGAWVPRRLLPLWLVATIDDEGRLAYNTPVSTSPARGSLSENGGARRLKVLALIRGSPPRGRHMPRHGGVLIVASAGLLLQAATSPRPCAASSTRQPEYWTADPFEAGPLHASETAAPRVSTFIRRGRLQPAQVRLKADPTYDGADPTHDGGRPRVRGKVDLLACELGGRPEATQTVGTVSGTIYGTVTDGTGAVLQDVSVVISSDVLIGDIGTRTDLTNAVGTYRLAALLPGDHTLVFARQGFRTVERHGIHVGIGFTARIDVKLEIATVREQVTVERQSPVIDADSTAITTSFDGGQLANLPSSRSRAENRRPLPGSAKLARVPPAPDGAPAGPRCRERSHRTEASCGLLSGRPRLPAGRVRAPITAFQWFSRSSSRKSTERKEFVRTGWARSRTMRPTRITHQGHQYVNNAWQGRLRGSTAAGAALEAHSGLA